MKKKTVIFYTIICFFMILTLTGCGKKTAITTNTFKEITQKHEYTAVDVITQYASYEYIKEATVAKANDDYQVEFYVLDNEENAKDMFNRNRNKFESSKGNVSSQNSVNLGNYSTYSLSTNGKYMYICRVDKTLLYIDVQDKFKDNVKELVKELGY